VVKPTAVEQSRAIPVDIQPAFDATLPVPLTTIFRRRYAVLPPIREVRGQDGTWGRIGQTRVVVTADGGTMREQLIDVDAPRSFTYRLSDITGPMRPLVDSVEGRWEFARAGTGTLVTWRWTLHPRGFGAPFMPLLCRMWRSYARQALEELSDLLLAPEPPERSAGWRLANAVSRPLIIAGPGPPGNLTERMELIVVLRVGVLHCDLGAEFDVRSDRLTERLVTGKVRRVGAAM
jgi:hypothetical protein